MFVSLLTFLMAALAFVLVERESKKGAKGVAASRAGTAAKVAGLLHLMSWYMQLHPGHGVFEGRKPALLEGLVQVKQPVGGVGPDGAPRRDILGPTPRPSSLHVPRSSACPASRRPALAVPGLTGVHGRATLRLV